MKLVPTSFKTFDEVRSIAKARISGYNGWTLSKFLHYTTERLALMSEESLEKELGNLALEDIKVSKFLAELGGKQKTKTS